MRYLPDDNRLYTNTVNRHYGEYIRCINKQKTVLDLTYMQEMTPEIASNTLDGTTATLTDRRDGTEYSVAKINGNMWMTENLKFGYNDENPEVSTLRLTEADSNITFTQAEAAQGYRELTTYDLASRGKDVANNNQCYGVNIDYVGYGPGYQYSCIHSGSNDYSGGNTTWYNYVLASAGTIYDENTDADHPATNTTTATESICPKGWSLPNNTQLASNRDTNVFSPVYGGYYNTGVLRREDAQGRWWGVHGYNMINRTSLDYNSDGKLYTGGFFRHAGYYIRCVQAS